jgi:hypothetical protein
MALAWIMWGTADDVRRHYLNWRAENWQWRGNENGFDLHQLTPQHSSFWYLQIDEVEQKGASNSPRLSATEARDQLWVKLRSGQVTMTALDQDGQAGKVPNDKFDHLEVAEVEGQDVLRIGDAVFYRAPRLVSADVRSLWPAAAADPESLCRAWLEEEMRKSPHQRPKTRDDFRTDALKKFDGLSKRGFGNVWRTAIAATGAEWNRPGRPTKKSSH